MAVLKVFQNGQWVEVGSTSASSVPAQYISNIDLCEVKVVGNDIIDVETTIPYSEDLQITMLSHTAPLSAYLEIYEVTQYNGKVLLTFSSREEINASALILAVPTTAEALESIVEVSREAVAASHTITAHLDRVERLEEGFTSSMGGCWIEFTDENGNPTDEPYIHWYSE